jgi:hypothetical protein
MSSALNLSLEADTWQTEKLKRNGRTGMIQGLVMQEYFKITDSQIYLCYTAYNPAKA